MQGSLPRTIAGFLDERLARLESACRDANVPFYDDAGVDDHLQRVLLASDFAYESFLRDPALLGPDLLRLMSDPRHADARAGVFVATLSEAELTTELRRFRLREALRLIWRDLNELDTIETTLTGASVLAETCIEAALAGAERRISARHGVIRDVLGAPQRMVVFGLGKLGGGELNFSSDIDLVFAFAEAGTSDGARPLDADAYYARIGQAFVALLAERNADGYVYRVDLRLRPFGQSGRTGAFVRRDGAVLPARRQGLGTLCMDQGARGRRRSQRRRAAARYAASVRVSPLSRLHGVRGIARDEGADRRRSRAQGSRRRSQARPRRHPRDRVHRAARAADPRRPRARASCARPVARARGLRAARFHSGRARG